MNLWIRECREKPAYRHLFGGPLSWCLGGWQDLNVRKSGMMKVSEHSSAYRHAENYNAWTFVGWGCMVDLGGLPFFRLSPHRKHDPNNEENSSYRREIQTTHQPNKAKLTIWLHDIIRNIHTHSLKLNHKNKYSPRRWWLGDYFLWGRPIFERYVWFFGMVPLSTPSCHEYWRICSFQNQRFFLSERWLESIVKPWNGCSAMVSRAWWNTIMVGLLT